MGGRQEAIMLKRLLRLVEARRYRWFHRRMAAVSADRKVVSFTFDDFPESAGLAGRELLERHGWKGTFYFAPGLAGQTSPLGQVASMEMARELNDAGHEIGNHTYSHMRCQAAPAAHLRTDLRLSVDALKAVGGTRSFALPFGAHDPGSLSVLSGQFDTVRTVEPGVNKGLTDLNALRAYRLYHSTDFEAIRRLIEDFTVTGGWLIFYTHDISEDPSPYGCTPAQFGQVLQWVAEKNLTVQTVAAAKASFDATGPGEGSRWGVVMESKT
jgi:peptidoglycan/xylan/chitin deacetylase (PgdA/CDA1 family)